MQTTDVYIWAEIRDHEESWAQPQLSRHIEDKLNILRGSFRVNGQELMCISSCILHLNTAHTTFLSHFVISKNNFTWNMLCLHHIYLRCIYPKHSWVCTLLMFDNQSDWKHGEVQAGSSNLINHLPVYSGAVGGAGKWMKWKQEDEERARHRRTIPGLTNRAESQPGTGCSVSITRCRMETLRGMVVLLWQSWDVLRTRDKRVKAY